VPRMRCDRNRHAVSSVCHRAGTRPGGMAAPRPRRGCRPDPLRAREEARPSSEVRRRLGRRLRAGDVHGAAATSKRRTARTDPACDGAPPPVRGRSGPGACSSPLTPERLARRRCADTRVVVAAPRRLTRPCPPGPPGDTQAPLRGGPGRRRAHQRCDDVRRIRHPGPERSTRSYRHRARYTECPDVEAPPRRRGVCVTPGPHPLHGGPFDVGAVPASRGAGRSAPFRVPDPAADVSTCRPPGEW